MILDAYLRCIIGWTMERNMEDSLSLTALRMALARRVVEPRLGASFLLWVAVASNDYANLLKDQRHRCKHVAQGNPADKTACESL